MTRKFYVMAYDRRRDGHEAFEIWLVQYGPGNGAIPMRRVARKDDFFAALSTLGLQLTAAGDMFNVLVDRGFAFLSQCELTEEQMHAFSCV